MKSTSSTVGRILSALVLFGGIFATIPIRADPPAAAESTTKKEAATPEKPSLARNFVRYLSLTARRSGVVERIFVKDGEKVKKGTLLLQLEDSEVRARIATARARFQVLEANHRLELVELNTLSRKQEVGATDVPKESIQARRDKADAEFAFAKLQLAEAELELNFYRIYAPRDGTIDRLFTQEGESVVCSPDKPVMSFSNP